MNSFTTPFHALVEALHITRQGIILGILNADSCLGREYTRKGGLTREAAFSFSMNELKHMVLDITQGNAMVVWRTTLGPFWPEARTLEIVSERWTLLIIRSLQLGIKYFNGLECGMPGISRDLISKRLKQL